jgi:hypothetical protein
VPITALGCIGIRSARFDDREGCAMRLLGLQRVDRGGQMRAFRMDDRAQRLVVSGAGEDGLAMIGREVPDAAALDALGARLDARPGCASCAAAWGWPMSAVSPSCCCSRTRPARGWKASTARRVPTHRSRPPARSRASAPGRSP